jgi:malate dehydrogenase
VLDGEFGQRNVSMSVPVKLGRTGAREIQEWTLAADEQPKFEKSAAAMSAAARIVDDVLQKIAE